MNFNRSSRRHIPGTRGKSCLLWNIWMLHFPTNPRKTGQNKQFFHFLLISYRQIIFAKIKREVFGERNNIKKTKKQTSNQPTKHSLKKRNINRQTIFQSRQLNLSHSCMKLWQNFQKEGSCRSDSVEKPYGLHCELWLFLLLNKGPDEI